MGWRYHAGLGLIGAFVLIWVSSAEITQRIFLEYKQPFALTYLGVTVMVIYFPISVCEKWICGLLKTLFRNIQEDQTVVTISTGLDIPFRMEGILQRPEIDLKCSLITDKEIREREEGMPLAKKEEDEPPLLAQSDENSSWKIAKCCLYLTPIWFAQEYFSILALANTSVASTTVLNSMSALFTLFFGAIIGQDSVNITKVAAVLISMAGVAMTTVGKTWAADDQISMTQKHSIMGDIFGLLSAVCYGLFTVLLKNSAGSEDKVDMQKLFGCIGLYSFLGFWWLDYQSEISILIGDKYKEYLSFFPLVISCLISFSNIPTNALASFHAAWPLNAVGIEPHFKFPSSRSTWELVIANSICSSVISDFLWALSIVWTAPLIATLGMSLTIPVAMIADMVIHGRKYSALYVLGCIQVFAGFTIANLSGKISGSDSELST